MKTRYKKHSKAFKLKAPSTLETVHLEGVRTLFTIQKMNKV
jgi:hypothetical protein